MTAQAAVLARETNGGTRVPWWQKATGYRDLAAQFLRQRRRRDRRHSRHHLEARPPRRPRHRLHLALAGLRLADGRHGLRHRRLPRHRAGVRHPRRLRPPDRRGEGARHRHRHGSRGEPLVRPARLVPPRHRGPQRPRARLLRLARPGSERRAALRAHRLLRRPGLELGRGGRPVLPRLFLGRPARPQLAEPAPPPGGLRHDELVARPRHRRVPHGRDQPDRQGPGRRHLRGWPGPAPLPAGDARGDAGRPRRGDRRRDLVGDARDGTPLLRPRPARAEHGLPVQPRHRLRRRRRRQVEAAPLRPRAASSSRSSPGSARSTRTAGTRCSSPTTTCRGRCRATATTARGGRGRPRCWQRSPT